MGDQVPSGKEFDFGAIEGAVNDAAKRVNAIWLALLFLMAYAFISTGKITHKDLFFSTHQSGFRSSVLTCRSGDILFLCLLS